MDSKVIESTIAKLREIMLRYCGNKVEKNTIENTIKNINNITIPDLEVLTSYEQLVSILVQLILHDNKHAAVFECLKTYRKSTHTGVFKIDNQFIMKYDSYTDLRLLRVYKILGIGINEQCKLVTPSWYSFIDHSSVNSASVTADNDSGSDSSDNTDDTHNDDDDDIHDINEDTPLTDTTEKSRNKQINTANLMTIEVQPMLQDSIVFYKWYKKTNFAMRDHDYIITKMMLSVAKSIKYCHDLNLVHGDIKPDNLIVINDLHSISNAHDNADDDHDDHLMRRNQRVPCIYLIDFGMCGRDNLDEGTGGTRPFCAPETNNVNNVKEVLAQNLKERIRKNNGISVESAASDEYMWGKVTKAQDVWSFGLILFSLVSYYNVYHYYCEYPTRTFDRSGFIRECELANDPEFSGHALYHVISKMLCPHENRASICEVITMIESALLVM